ncbi:MAG: hypothetical protein J6A04_01785 [Clostridia bacterium]|nr:hypothetical protein [Clostridia bacterium]
MIKLTKKNQKGITLVTLSIAIIIMLIITATLVYNITTGAKVRALNNMYQDVTKIKDKVDLYYASHRTIPILETKYENVTHLQSINPNDSSTYYVVDLEALENLNLIYGKDYNTYKTAPSNQLTDIYVINEKSHSIYYVKGISLDNNMYYTMPEESTKVTVNSITSIQNVKMDQNIAVVSINAANKENGITQIKLIVNDQEYKTYDYTSNWKEAKTETLNMTLAFGKDYVCYLQMTDEEGNTTTSDSVTLQNLTTIATVEDLQNLATLVNDGTNTFSGQTINLINDLDLNGSEDNQWVPIGNINYAFSGIFEGNENKISGIYCTTELEYTGLFGAVIDGKIRNLGIENIIIKNNGGCSGGITGLLWNSEIINCYAKGNISASLAGGINGFSQKGAKITNSYHIGNVIGNAESYPIAGGIVGRNYEMVENCYHVGNIDINTGERKGGIIGFNVDGDAKNCYYLQSSTVTGGIQLSDIEGKAEGKTQEQLKLLAGTLGSAFKTDTNNINDGYPILTWQE